MKALFSHAARSVLTRILLVEVATILAASVLMPMIASSVLQSSVAAIQDDLLRQQAGLVAQHVQRAGALWRVVLPPEQVPIYASGYDGRAYALIDADGRLLDASAFALASTWPNAFRKGQIPRFAEGDMVGLSIPLHDQLRVVVTQDQARPGAVVDDVVRRFLSRYLVLLVGLLVLMPVANVAMLWPLLRRLRRTAREAARLNPQSAGARLDARGLPAETLALVEAINDLLGRVEAALRLQEEFAGNVAHELRTPLATMRLEVAKLPDDTARAVLAHEIERIAHVLAQLRDLASLENAARLSLAPVDLSDLVIALVAEMTPGVLAGGRSIAVVGGEAPIVVQGNRGLLTMALTNLIDNAQLHTPPGAAIEVELDASGTVTIADDGPGITETDQSRLVSRFWRADRRRSDGAGLGLSIVQRIAAAHHGRLIIASAPQGGARFTLMLNL